MENGGTGDLIDYNAIIYEQLHLFLLLFIKFAILCFVTFIKFYYLNYSGDRRQKIIPWERAQGPQFSCVYAWYKSAFNPLNFKNRGPIYRTGVPLPSRCCILYIFQQI